MSTLGIRSKTALLIVDVHNGVVDGVYKRDEVVQNNATLLTQACADPLGF